MGRSGIGGSARSKRTSARHDAGPTPQLDPAPDWPVQATRQIVKTVDSVRDATTGRALNAARFIVYGTVIASLGVPLGIVMLLFMMRLIEHGLLKIGESRQWTWLNDPIWIVYLSFGTAFLVAGLYLWRSANKAAPPST